MARTNHHRGQKWRHCGEDFWSRRAGMGHCLYNTYGKRLTISRERVENKTSICRTLKSRDYE